MSTPTVKVKIGREVKLGHILAEAFGKITVAVNGQRIVVDPSQVTRLS